MTSLIKLGIAVGCLLAVAAFIAMDLNRPRPEAPAAVPETGLPVAVAPPVAPLTVPVPSEIPGRPPQAAPADPREKKGEASEAAAGTETPKAPAPAIAPAPVKPPLVEILPGGTRIYTVVQGDSLYGISVKVFGTPRHYERIYEANKDRISDPNTLQIGMKLTLPDVPSKPGAGSSGPTGLAPQPASSGSSESR